MCVRMWPRSSQGLEKALPQVGHTQGSVWERMCIFRAPRLVYSLGQCLQWKDALGAEEGMVVVVVAEAEGWLEGRPCTSGSPALRWWDWRWWDWRWWDRAGALT